MKYKVTLKLSIFMLFVKIIPKMFMKHGLKFEMNITIKINRTTLYFAFSTQHRIWSFHVVVLQRTVK